MESRIRTLHIAPVVAFAAAVWALSTSSCLAATDPGVDQSTGPYSTPIMVVNRSSETVVPKAFGLPDGTAIIYDALPIGQSVTKNLPWSQSSDGKTIESQIWHEISPGAGWRMQTCKLNVTTMKTGYPRQNLQVVVNVVETDKPLPGDVKCTISKGM